MYDQLRLLKVTSIKRNGPASILSNLNPRLTSTKIEKFGHCKQQQSHCRSTAKNCVNHVPCSRVFCVAYWVYWPVLDRRAQMNGSAVPWRIFFYRIPSAKRMKKKKVWKKSWFWIQKSLGTLSVYSQLSLRAVYRKSPKISPSKYKPPKLVTQKTLR